MNELESLKQAIVTDLENAGKVSPYKADANEPDPRYKSYGVRAPQKKEIFKHHRPTIRKFDALQQIELATALIHSGYGEQQSLGLWIIERHADFFVPARLNQLDQFARSLYGWSKVDEFAGSLFKQALFAHPEPFLELVQAWNQDTERWLRRLSVVLFTRKVAASGRFTDFALRMCDNLKFAPEDLVRKGVGWALKDLMRADRERILAYVHLLRQQKVPTVITSYAIRNLTRQEKAEFLASGLPNKYCRTIIDHVQKRKVN